MKEYFIVGKECESYMKTLDEISKMPVVNLRLHEDAFRNWKVNVRTSDLRQKK